MKERIFRETNFKYLDVFKNDIEVCSLKYIKPYILYYYIIRTKRHKNLVFSRDVAIRIC